MMKFSVQVGCVFFAFYFVLLGRSIASEYYNPNQAYIDKNSSRAMLNQNRPLWDGTYPQADGSTIWVRNGVATSNRATKQSPWLPPRHQTNHSTSCLQLVHQSCGLNNECINRQDCQLALQMEQLRKDEEHFDDKQTQRYGKVMGAECQKALTEFKSCQNYQPKADNACQKLKTYACGVKQQCHKSDACRLSSQLMAMQKEEQMLNLDSTVPTLTEKDCRKALVDTTMFPACNQ